MVDNIQLTSQQKLQQEKINAYIQSLEESLVAGADDIQLDDNLHTTLAGVFDAFDASGDGQFDGNETQVLVDHLKNLNSDENIATMFDTNGNLKFDTGGVDVDNNGNAGGQNDFVALDNILSSKASVDYAESVMTGSGSKITLDDGSQVSHGLGNNAVTFQTKGGYHIVTDTNNGGHQTKIYDSDGKMLTHVSGDPHVNEGESTANGGWDWHFGDDSTFILDDGTEIFFNTTGNANSNVFTTRGLYIISDDDVYQTGLDMSDTGARNSELTKLDMSAIEFDATYADTKLEEDGADTFVYSKEANDGNGGWAVLTDEGTFEDIAYESWGDYKKGKNDGVSQTFDGQTVDTGSVVNDSINLEQKEAALDGEAVRIYDRLEKTGATDEQKEAFFDYYFEEGANDAMLNAYTTLVDMGGNQAQFDMLDAYIKDPTEIGAELTSEQEGNYLIYMITDEALADMYLELVNKANTEVDDNGNPIALNVAKLELFEESTLGEDAISAAQAEKMLEYADQDMAIAESYVDLIQGGAEAEKVTIFENYLDKVGEVNSVELNNFVDVLTDADETETALLGRLVSDENGSMALLDATLDIMNNPSSVSIREKQSSMTSLLMEYAFGQEDLFTDIISYQNSQLSNEDQRERQIMTQNADMLAALGDASAGRGTYGDILSNESQEHLGEIFTKLDGGNSDMSELGDVLEVFNQSMMNGRATEDREAFYKDLFEGLLEIDPAGMSDEDFTAAVSESVFLSIQEAKEEGTMRGFRFDQLEELVIPYAASAQSEEFATVELDEGSNSMIDALKANSDYELVGVISSAFAVGNEDFVTGFNEIVEENPNDIDKIAQETAQMLVDMYEAMIETELAKTRPSMYMVRTWQSNVSQLEGIADS